MRCVSITLAILAVGCTEDQEGTVHPERPEPRAAAEFAPAYIDIGPGLPGREVKGELTLHNRSDEQLAYRLETSCGCTAAEPRVGTVAAGSSQGIAVTLEMPRIAGQGKTVTVTAIDAGGSGKGLCTATVRSDCPPVFRLEPDKPRFAADGNAEVATITLSCDPTLASFESTADAIVADGAEVKVIAESEDELDVRLRRGVGQTTSVRIAVTATALADGQPVTESFWIRPVAEETVVVSPPVLRLPTTGAVGTVLIRGVQGERVVGVDVTETDGLIVDVDGDAGTNIWTVRVRDASNRLAGGPSQVHLEISLQGGSSVRRSVAVAASRSG